ncbi:MAG: glycoside hydrolase family 5 protein [Ruminococcaceae bacterium]|nr:glycoside hydrolase family 5 protein [Oscillospiraceae bacterium]
MNCFERCEKVIDNSVNKVFLICENEKTELFPFPYQPINITYDEGGYETIEKSGEEILKIRFTPVKEGNYTLEYTFDDGNKKTESFVVEKSENNGYIKVSDKDKNYFSFSSGKKFYPIGINLTYPTAFMQSNGNEFGRTKIKKYIGLKQYEAWFKKCSKNGVNLVRLWIGHEYFSPDTLNCYEYNLEKFSLLDEMINLAKKYNIYLKLTLEQFRYFKYDENDDSQTFHIFNKNLYLDGERCEDIQIWLRDEKWKNAYLSKINEFAKRYGGEVQIFAIELWNEMNCVGPYHLEWNKEMLPKVKAMFPLNMVINSLGSLDSDRNYEIYKNFCWDKSSFMQVHRYLDLGAKHEKCRDNLVEVIKDGADLMKEDGIPLLIAETGAVEKCHSGPFKYYSHDDDGIFFVDSVYTAVFTKCAGCGNIWHWDERYVESKNLYKYFKPLSDLICDTDFENENFKCFDFSNDDVHLLIMEGNKSTIGFIRNKSHSWKNVLRDLGDVKPIKRFETEIKSKSVKTYPIWENDSVKVKIENGKIKFEDLNFGIIFKAEK